MDDHIRIMMNSDQKIRMVDHRRMMMTGSD